MREDQRLGVEPLLSARISVPSEANSDEDRCGNCEHERLFHQDDPCAWPVGFPCLCKSFIKDSPAPPEVTE